MAVAFPPRRWSSPAGRTRRARSPRSPIWTPSAVGCEARRWRASARWPRSRSPARPMRAASRRRSRWLRECNGAGAYRALAWRDRHRACALRRISRAAGAAAWSANRYGAGVAIVRAYALIIAVCFTFVADGALIFSTPGPMLADAAQAIYGRPPRARCCLSKRAIGEGARLSGAIASRATHFANREPATLAVNGRPITTARCSQDYEAGNRPLLGRGGIRWPSSRSRFPPARSTETHP